MLACPNTCVEYETITGRTANWDEGYLSLQRKVKANGHDPGLGYSFKRKMMAGNKRGVQEQGSS